MDSIWTCLMNTEFKLAFADANGIRTRYLEAGKGDQTVIFIHGTGGHLEAYYRNIAEHAKHFRVIAYDMVGCGYTDKVTDRNYELPEYVDHLYNFMDALGIEKASLHGESLGGWVAGKFALQYPNRVEKLILNTSGGMKEPDPTTAEKAIALNMMSVTNPTEEGVRKRLEFLVHKPEDITDELVDVRLAIYSQPNMIPVMEKISALFDPQICRRNMFSEEELQSIKAPTCVIWTEHDPLAGPEIGEKFASLIPNAEYHCLSDSAHWPQFEEAELVNKLHIEFLKK